MRIDKTTLHDLSVFLPGGGGIFGLIDHTTSHAGREALRRMIHNPPADSNALREVQDTVRFWTQHLHHWPQVISNGTLVMLEKFFQSADSATAAPSGINLLLSSFFQKLVNRNEYFYTQFSLSHIADFLKGCTELCRLAEAETLPPLLQRETAAMQHELEHRLTASVLQINDKTSYKEMARISHAVRRDMKHTVLRLMQHYARIDAWQSMARATITHHWTFPGLLPGDTPVLEAKGLYHPLLEKPIPYDTGFRAQKNFMVLTGANMSGKTTFMRALGVAALLAHVGMGVPAAAMHISFLEGIITNMHVEDNLLRGESYFFAEVQRMKHTAEKLINPGTHLVLMDELFKGTNVHDAFECTRAVMEGLLLHPNHLMVLSTHLYEAAQHFRDKEGMLFTYFVTEMKEDHNYHFTYQLKEGISDDRIGYRILQQAGVLNLLMRMEN